LSAPIRPLPSEVADAIAAGEVVERPAAVVKELVENSLDAGALRIAIEVRGAGRSLVRVADDGVGVPARELRLALTRHATSKVTGISDLDRIQTLGFRGEALASIAAVADVEMRSGGGRIRAVAAEVVEEGSAPAVTGTVVEVRDLFANTPARLKFLKADATETAGALRAVQSYALIHAGVRFELTVDGRRVLMTPGDGDRLAALAAIHGSQTADEMLDARYDGPPSVEGLVSQPRLSRGTRDGVLIAVNHRPVVSRALGFALEDSYRGALERGRYPIAVLDIGLDPQLVDVNVHPAKREVRFRDEGAVFVALQKAVRAALTGADPYRLAPATAARSWTSAPSARPLAADAQAALAVVEAPAAAVAAPLRALGQVQDGYIVAEAPEGLLLVDQHAAHERVLYNRFLGRLAGGATLSQPLLLPQVMELSPDQVAALESHRDQLARLGFAVDDFGHRTARLLAAPAEIPAGRAAAALEKALDAMDARSPDRGLEAAAASIACHAAVRFGDVLDGTSQRRLLDELAAATDSLTCPHGRPTRLVLDWPDLRRRFGRNY
jgi:DNA mismatch repair protein MutL